jgi:hypothetical protein
VTSNLFLPEARARPSLKVVGEPAPLAFDAEGSLTSPFGV